MLGRAASCGSGRSFLEVGPPSRPAGYGLLRAPRPRPISVARCCRSAGLTMLWTYIRTHSNDGRRCGETSPLPSVAGRSQCPSDAEVKLITRPSHATDRRRYFRARSVEGQCICKSATRNSCSRGRTEGSELAREVGRGAARGFCSPPRQVLFASNVHRCTARRDRRVALPPETAFSKTSTISIPLVINPAIRCNPPRSCIASMASSGATANFTLGGI